MEDLILNVHVIFDNNVASAEPNQVLTSPPLPAVPLDDVQEQSDSSTDPGQAGPSDMPRRQRHNATFGQDFTPELPPRPGNSIHPSHRSLRTPSQTESESDSDGLESPPLPPRPSSLEAIVLQASLSSADSQASPSPPSELQIETSNDKDIPEPPVDPSTPASVQPPLAIDDAKKDDVNVGTVRPSTKRSVDQSL